MQCKFFFTSSAHLKFIYYYASLKYKICNLEIKQVNYQLQKVKVVAELRMVNGISIESPLLENFTVYIFKLVESSLDEKKKLLI